MLEKEINVKKFLKYGVVIATILTLFPLLLGNFVVLILTAIISFGSLCAVICNAWMEEEDSEEVGNEMESTME